MFKFLFGYFKNIGQIIYWFVKSRLMSSSKKDLEILALRSQLAIFQEKIENKKIKTPHFTTAFRQLWMFLSRFFENWESALIIVKPETVVGWHRKGFKLFWRFKSRKRGRPPVSMATINLIKKIHKENPLLSPEKIHERLVDLNIIDAPAPNTIAKYIPHLRKPPTQKQIQSWKTFLKNHSKGIWAMDFFVVPTLLFEILYVFVIISHDRRKIEYINVTSNPHSNWVAQQIRNATAFNETPKYLIHDNDPIFRSKYFQAFLKNCTIKAKRIGYKAPQQNGVCERVIKTFRDELVNHIIPFNETHLRNLINKYVNDYYNPVRTHQAIDCKTPIAKDELIVTKVSDTTLIAKPILNGLYCDYEKVA